MLASVRPVIAEAIPPATPCRQVCMQTDPCDVCEPNIGGYFQQKNVIEALDNS
jgi:hypothetical protein